jgi:membrane-bound hydrogenase subunit alpha
MSNTIEKTGYTLPLGPIHPALHEPIRLDLSIDGEEIVDVDVAAGQVHRGIEWIAMNRNNPVQTIYLAERICGICSACHPYAFVSAVEMAAGIEVPPAQTTSASSSRKLNAFTPSAVGRSCRTRDRFESLFYYVWRAREKVMDLTEILTGNRNSKAMFQIGGVRRDVTPEQIPVIRETLDYYKSVFDEIKKLFLDDPTVKMRTRHVGVISTEDAKRLCISGPTARARGVAPDVRQDHAYSAYADLGVKAVTPDIITGEVVGDVYDRIIVRLLEVKQSIELIEKCVEAMPEGPLLSEPKIAKLLAALKKAEGRRWYALRRRVARTFTTCE